MSTRKVVINACYGGFSMSPAAVRRLAEMDRRPCYFFVNDRDANGDLSLRRYRRVSEAEAAKAVMWYAFDIPDVSELAAESDRFHEMTHEERMAHNERWTKHTIDSREYRRDDPSLIRIVEELGADASGSCAELKIVEIPADVEWEISEYDGNEWVSEKHRRWS